MILVDTSVWIDYFAGKELIVRPMLELIDRDRVVTCRPVRLELKAGVSVREERKLFQYFDAVPNFEIDLEDWHTVEDWVHRSRAKGQAFGLIDLLIGAVAARRGLRVGSRDSDFDRLGQLGFVQCYR